MIDRYTAPLVMVVTAKEIMTATQFADWEDANGVSDRLWQRGETSLDIAKIAAMAVASILAMLCCAEFV